MFPSGSWRGYWEQPEYGRQEMRGLVLRFADGEVTGEGTDLIGPFIVRGNYASSGSMSLVKQYVGRHQVLYLGQHDGEGTVFGRWSIPPWSGGTFALAPAVTPPPVDAPIQELRPTREGPVRPGRSP
jgi:hypothetical protein